MGEEETSKDSQMTQRRARMGHPTHQPDGTEEGGDLREVGTATAGTEPVTEPLAERKREWLSSFSHPPLANCLSHGGFQLASHLGAGEMAS
jgi:hypothetical protein